MSKEREKEREKNAAQSFQNQTKECDDDGGERKKRARWTQQAHACTDLYFSFLAVCRLCLCRAIWMYICVLHFMGVQFFIRLLWCCCCWWPVFISFSAENFCMLTEFLFAVKVRMQTLLDFFFSFFFFGSFRVWGGEFVRRTWVRA